MSHPLTSILFSPLHIPFFLSGGTHGIVALTWKGCPTIGIAGFSIAGSTAGSTDCTSITPHHMATYTQINFSPALHIWLLLTVRITGSIILGARGPSTGVQFRAHWFGYPIFLLFVGPMLSAGSYWALMDLILACDIVPIGLAYLRSLCSLDGLYQLGSFLFNMWAHNLSE